jgi:hypothetical protein
VVSPASTEDAVKETDTDAIAAGVTVILALPETPSLAAVIVADPADIPDTRPVAASTVATATLSELHSTGRPIMTRPLASASMATAWVVSSARSELASRATLIDETGAGVIVNVALPGFPSLVAVIRTVPTLIAVTTPSTETVATSELSELHSMIRSVRVPPPASTMVALACVVATALIELAERVTETPATGTRVTVTITVAIFPSLVAVIAAVPGATPRITPSAAMVATSGLADDHVMALALRALPLASSAVALATVVFPTSIVADASDAVTDATGTGLTLTGALPFFPSLVAMIFAVPALIAVTRPVAETVATAALSELQSIALPGRTLLFASRAVARA